MLRLHHACCVVTRLVEGRCSIVLPAGRSSIVSGTKYQANHSVDGPLCDGLIAHSLGEPEIRLAAVELKGGLPDVVHAAAQLQGGADLLEHLGVKGEGTAFIPLLVTNRLPTVASRRLGSLSVRYKGQKYRIRHVKCGAHLNVSLWEL